MCTPIIKGWRHSMDPVCSSMCHPVCLMVQAAFISVRLSEPPRPLPCNNSTLNVEIWTTNPSLCFSRLTFNCSFCPACSSVCIVRMWSKWRVREWDKVLRHKTVFIRSQIGLPTSFALKLPHFRSSLACRFWTWEKAGHPGGLQSRQRCCLGHLAVQPIPTNILLMFHI